MRPWIKEEKETRRIRIVLIDDDFLIRYALKAAFFEFSRKTNIRIEVYTSSNGVEGLGQILAAVPDVILIDSTLPRYSGREIFDFLTTNKKFEHKKIAILHEGDFEIARIPHVSIFNKRDRNFLNRLLSHVNLYLSERFNDRKVLEFKPLGAHKAKIISVLLFVANYADIRVRNIITKTGFFFKTKEYFLWFFAQIFCALILTFSYITIGKVHDTNIHQHEGDNGFLRTRSYPTLITVFTAIIFLALQFILYVTGGIIIMNREIESVFAFGK